MVSPASASIGFSLQMQLEILPGRSTTNNHGHCLAQRTWRHLISVTILVTMLGELGSTASDIGSAGRNSTFIPIQISPTDFYGSRLRITLFQVIAAVTCVRLKTARIRRTTTNWFFTCPTSCRKNQNNNAGVGAVWKVPAVTRACGKRIAYRMRPAAFSGARINTNGRLISKLPWKIAVIVPSGGGSALSRITTTNRVIAVYIPNIDLGTGVPWSNYSPR